MIGNEKGVMYARTMRRAAQGYQPDVLKVMKGVPWDPLAGVENLQLKRPRRLRIPELPPIAERVPQGSPGDEAASDPPSSEPGSSCKRWKELQAKLLQS